MRAGAERSEIRRGEAFLSYCSVWGYFQPMSGPHPVKASSGSLLSRFVSKANLICRLYVWSWEALCDVQNTGKFLLLEKFLQGGRLRELAICQIFPLHSNLGLQAPQAYSQAASSQTCQVPVVFRNLKEIAKLLLQCMDWQLAPNQDFVTVANLPPTTDKKIVRVSLITHASVSSRVK